MSENKIQLPGAIIGDWTFAQFDSVCTHFLCVLEGKTKGGDWIISAEDPVNFFWLGGNLSMRGSGTWRTIPIVDSVASENELRQILVRKIKTVKK